MADPDGGAITLADHGSGYSPTALESVPDTVPQEDYDDDIDDPLGRRLTGLLDHLERSAPAGSTDDRPFEAAPAPDPVAQDRLPSLFAGDFVPGLTIGVLTGPLAFGLVAAVVATARRSRRPAPQGAAPDGPFPAPPTRP